MITEIKQYYEMLDDEEKFKPVLDFFIQSSVKEQKAQGISSQNQGIPFHDFYEKMVTGVFPYNAELVFRYCQSPIEKKFLNSFLLLFLKNRQPCLFLTPPFVDAEKEIGYRRKTFSAIEAFLESYRRVTGDTEMIHFEERLKEKQKQGEVPDEDFEEIMMFKNFQQHFVVHAYHITPQAAFPHFKVGNRSIRADFLIWVPGDPSIKIILECDGFRYHNTQDQFSRDRARDRIFMLHGYRVIRFAGRDIVHDPVKVASELYDLLITVDEDTDEKRLI
jgi:hypothetical protein